MMNQSPPTYIVAVSGGVDSCVLLHMLVNHSDLLGPSLREDSVFVVAHANHGIRGARSDSDRDFVEKLASHYGLQFESEDLKLGADASEEQARDARYAFLESVQRNHQAEAIILAHHTDDIIETAIINSIRGTGRRGLTSLSSDHARVRPLLHLTKEQIISYAEQNKLQWVEDESNSDPRYLRNKIRSSLKRSGKTDQKQKFATELQKLKQKNDLLDKEIATLLQYKLRDKAIISRSWFVKLPHVVACELMYAVVNKISVSNVNRDLIERLVISLKVARPGTKLDIDKETIAIITKRSLRFVKRQTLKTHRV